MQIQILFLSNSASSRAIVHAALNSSDQMAAISCTGIPELLGQFCQNNCDLLLIEPEEFVAADLKILLRFIPNSIPVVFLLEEQNEFEINIFSCHAQVEILTKLNGYLTALPYLVQNYIHRKNDRGDSATAPYVKSALKAENGWCELGAEMRIQRSSPAMGQLLEMPQKDLEQFRLPDLFHTEARTIIDGIVARSSSNTDEFLLEIRGREGNGESKFFVINFQRISNHLQETTGWRCDFFYHSQYRPAPAPNEDKKSFVEHVFKLVQVDFKMTFPIFYRSVAEKCASAIACEQITSVRFNATSGKFVSDAIHGQELPVTALLQNGESSIFPDKNSGKPRLHFFSVAENRTIPVADNHIKTPAGFGLDGGILLSFSEMDGTPIGCLALAGLPAEPQIEAQLQQLHIIALLVSLVLQSYCDKSEQAKKERRLQQILVSGSIFKLQLPMRSLMREMAWAIKFSFDAFLTALALFDKKDSSLGFYAVASDDKHLILSLAEERIKQSDFLACLQNGETIRKSHLVADIALSGGIDLLTGTSGSGFIVTPIFDLDGKMMGAIINCERRNECIFDISSITILETVAKQIAVGISNRVIYSRLLKQQNAASAVHKTTDSNGQISKSEEKPPRFWQRIFS